MLVRVIYDNGRDYAEFEYFSEFKRINAKGIKDEIQLKIYQNWHRHYKIIQFYRVND